MQLASQLQHAIAALAPVIFQGLQSAADIGRDRSEEVPQAICTVGVEVGIGATGDACNLPEGALRRWVAAFLKQKTAYAE